MVCPVCGTKFTRSISSLKSKHGSSFCSPACQYRARTIGITPRIVIHPYTLTTEGRIAMQANAVRVHQLRRQRNNYGHTDKTRALLSKMTALAIADGRFPRVSGIEGVVAKELSDQGLAFIPQFFVRDNMGRFACTFDFFLPDHNVAIEVNGTFWHSDPRFYPNGPTCAVQRRNADAWLRKVAIANELNVRIIQIWEYDIRQNAPDAVASACWVLLR
jgi:G:T-mismatch repair DNA endonuclease (very short patch repair protein)